MPTLYKAELQHEPLEWGVRERRRQRGEAADSSTALARPGKDRDVIGFLWALRSRREAIIAALGKCGVELGRTDRAAFLTEVRFLLAMFVAECRAHPLRTPMMLLPTVKAIRRDPIGFLAKVEDFSPEAVALVYQEYRRLFPARRDLAAFEAGLADPPEAADIALAADAAIAVLEQEADARGKGRTYMKPVEELAVDLGKLFLGYDGHLRRTVHEHESGPFHEFLTVIAEPLRPMLRDTGYTLTPKTMVDFARKALVR